jgi:hypothetical protein
MMDEKQVTVTSIRAKTETKDQVVRVPKVVNTEELYR